MSHHINNHLREIAWLEEIQLLRAKDNHYLNKKLPLSLLNKCLLMKKMKIVNRKVALEAILNMDQPKRRGLLLLIMGVVKLLAKEQLVLVIILVQGLDLKIISKLVIKTNRK